MRWKRKTRRLDEQLDDRVRAAAESKQQADKDLAASRRRAAEAARIAARLRALNTANHFDEALISHWRGRRA